MARTTRIIWGKWDCSTCSTKGISAEPPPGETQPRCPHCGNPREQNAGEAAYLDNARDSSGRVLGANVADTAREVAIATAGADWTCGRCGGDNRAGNPQCDGCGASRNDALAPRNLGGSALPLLSSGKGLAALILTVMVPLGGWGGFHLYTTNYTQDLPGTITSLHWQHTVDLQTFVPATTGDWHAGLVESPAVMPVNGAGESPGVADIRDCEQRHHHDEQYACGTENVCVQKSRSVDDGQDCHEVCSTSDNGNGSFTETCDDVCSTSSHTEYYEECHDQTKYCSRSIDLEWCTYDTWRWEAAGQVELRQRQGASSVRQHQNAL